MNTENATDRNIKTAVGLFSGHITLPSSFLTCLLAAILGTWGYTMSLAFNQMDNIRERLKDQENVNVMLMQTIANKVPDVEKKQTPQSQPRENPRVEEAKPKAAKEGFYF